MTVLLIVTSMLAAACEGNAANPPASDPSPDPPARTPTPTAEPMPPPTPTPDQVDASEPVASTATIPTHELPRVRFLASDGTEAMLPIEVPPPEEYRIGLSGRHELAGRGMLFYYPSGEATSGFWMRNTHIDLDIAFVNEDREVLEVLRMEANTDTIHRPADPYLAAIEAPAGWFEDHGIGPGARVEFLFEIPEEIRVPR